MKGGGPSAHLLARQEPDLAAVDLVDVQVPRENLCWPDAVSLPVEQGCTSEAGPPLGAAAVAAPQLRKTLCPFGTSDRGGIGSGHTAIVASSIVPARASGAPGL